MKLARPLVSIIIPVYNGSNYMREAIDSALSQTYDNIEIIVVNDGSNDKGKTRKIALSYGNKIRYFEKENGGVSTALNFALKQMKGEYFSWLSHDDRYYPDKIEKQIDYLKRINKENVILYSNYDLMNEYSEVYAKSIFNHEELINKPSYALLRGAINGITLLIPKKAFTLYGNFSESLRCTQDYVKWAEFMKTYTFIHQEDILATSRVHSLQTGNTSPKMLIEGNEFWTNYIESFSDEEKIKLDRTIYNYYYGLYNFMKLSPYNDTTDYIENKLKTIYNNFKFKNSSLEVILIVNDIEKEDRIINYVNSLLSQTYSNLNITLINYKSKKKFNDNKRVKVSKSDFADAINMSDADYICIMNNMGINELHRFDEQIKFMELTKSKICYISEKEQLLDKKNFIVDLHYNIIKMDSIIIDNTYVKENDILVNKEEDSLFKLILDLNLAEIDYLNEELVEYTGLNVEIDNKLDIYKVRLKNVLNSSYMNNNDIVRILTEEVCGELYKLNVSNCIITSGRRNYISIIKSKGLLYCMKKVIKKIIGGK